MNKFGLSIVLSLGLALSPLCALDSKESKKNMQSSSLNQADAEFLFTANADSLNVVALSEKEMQKTEGESFIVFGAGLWGGMVIYRVFKAF